MVYIGKYTTFVPRLSSIWAIVFRGNQGWETGKPNKTFKSVMGNGFERFLFLKTTYCLSFNHLFTREK